VGFKAVDDEPADLQLPSATDLAVAETEPTASGARKSRFGIDLARSVRTRLRMRFSTM